MRRQKKPKRETRRDGRTVGIAAASVAACAAPNPSAAGDGTSGVVGLMLLSAAARSRPADSRLTRATREATSAYGAGEGADGYAGSVAASSSPSRAPGLASGGLGAPSGMASSHAARSNAPVMRRVAEPSRRRRVTCASSLAAAEARENVGTASARASARSAPPFSLPGAHSNSASCESAVTARRRPVVVTVHSLVDVGARSSAPVMVAPPPPPLRETTHRSLASGRAPAAVAASAHQPSTCASTAAATAPAEATWHRSRQAAAAAAAVSASSSRSVAWNETRIAVVATASTQSSRAAPGAASGARVASLAFFDVPPPERMSSPSVRHTARRTAAIGCAANGKSDGTTSRSVDPGPFGGVERVSGSAYRALTSRITGTFEGLVRRSGSSSLPSKLHRPASRGGKSGCVGRCLAAGSSASAAPPRTSSSLSSSAAVAAGSAAGSRRGASASRAASTYLSASSALCRTSHSGRRSNTSTQETTASTAFGGSGNKPAPSACAPVSRTGATTPSPT